jgi:hypothetical protein
MTLEQMRRYPQFVYFKNLNDPKTVEKAAQRKIVGGQPYGAGWSGGQVVGINFDENIVGKAVTLKDVTFEPAYGFVTTGIEKYLPWLPERGKLPGPIGSDPATPLKDPSKTNLIRDHFSTGRFW